MLAAEQRSGTQRDESADGGARQCEDRKFAAEVAAKMIDREEPEGQDAAFKCCRKDGADGARDDANDDV